MSSGQYEQSDQNANFNIMAAKSTSSSNTSDSNESSKTPPVDFNGFQWTYNQNRLLGHPIYPSPGEDCLVPIGMIPVELDAEVFFEDQDQRSGKRGGKNADSPGISSRRRAQNRASQRAFRARKEKLVKELERKLEELEGRHNYLSLSYESLQLEYSTMKQELDKTREENEILKTASLLPWRATSEVICGVNDLEGDMGLPLFDISAFYCSHTGESVLTE
ncbi:hypothetical protein DL95DRAFT_418604 [Leptodontidium sp. 2 PMI_412]|nr:hypothetical protein DL95DRAFT_418604 [Leptodontidium sp. 2 PMI_412]